jgi:hypothetical protein
MEVLLVPDILVFVGVVVVVDAEIFFDIVKSVEMSHEQRSDN